MKKIVLIIWAVLFCLAAQAQVAVVDSKQLMAAVPQLAKADTLVNQKAQQLGSAYGQKRYQAQLQAGVADSLYKLNPTDSLTQLEQAKTARLAEELALLEKQSSKELEDYRSLLITPYIDKINAAIGAVATSLKYKQVIDIQSVPLVWTDPAADITISVIAELKKH